MGNTFGTNLKVTLFGESHGPAVGCVVDGLPPGVRVRSEAIAMEMEKRKARGAIATARHEADEVKILSGVKDGFAEGSPLTIVIENHDVRRSDYENRMLRPSHADYTAYVKYGGYEDFSGGGHFSGRLTAPLCAAGAIVKDMLEDKGIRIGSHIARLADVCDRDFADLKQDIEALNQKLFPVLDDTAGEKMMAAMAQAKAEGDSLGGILQTAVFGLPAGIGEPFFDSLEGIIAHAVFAIPAVKGIAFGSGFGFAGMKGSQANDLFACEQGKIVTLTNHNGGINGGIANGMPVIFETVIKPTPSIALPQVSVSPLTKQAGILEIKGRHDPAVIHRARPAVDAMTAFCLADQLLARYGPVYFAGRRKV